MGMTSCQKSSLIDDFYNYLQKNYEKILISKTNVAGIIFRK